MFKHFQRTNLGIRWYIHYWSKVFELTDSLLLIAFFWELKKHNKKTPQNNIAHEKLNLAAVNKACIYLANPFTTG